MLKFLKYLSFSGIHGLFNDVYSIETMQRRVMGWWMDDGNLERIDSGPIVVLHRHLFVGTQKKHEKSVRTAGDSPEIRSEHLPNIKS
jgi:hypothetical protein